MLDHRSKMGLNVGIMKLQLRDLVGGGEALAELAQMEIPILTSYKISKNLRAISAETEPYFEARKKLLDPFVEEETGLVRIPPNKVDGVNDHMKPLLDVEVDVKIVVISIEDLGDFAVKPAILAGAWFMFKEE